MKFIERNLWKVAAIIALLFLATQWKSAVEFSRDVGVVTSCRATACGFDR